MSETEHKELAYTGVDVVDVASDIARFAAMGLLPQLLANHATGGNIVWASSVFVDKGDSYAPTDEILVSDITGDNAGLIRTRASKAKEAQAALTRAHAEVFTPTWVVKLMVNEADKAWWESHEDATWQDYVRSPRLEITCGEAPYLVGRYDAADGAPVPLDERVGILDRKLSRIPHYFKRRSWITWVANALKSTYGYEFQGDNLLIARVNVLATIEDYAKAAGHWPLTPSEYRKFVDIIGWNLWQMDGLSDCVPFGDADKDIEVEYTPTLFDVSEYTVGGDSEQMTLFVEIPGDDFARVYDWVNDKEILFRDIKRGGCAMKFDYVIGNPPYNEERRGDTNTTLPIYHHFMSASFEVSDVVELITPARFLFNAGRTPKPWNKKMLGDPHFKVIQYFNDATEAFPNTDIKGGVAITIRDVHRDFGPIGTFTVYDEINSILRKVRDGVRAGSFASLGFVASKFNTANLFADYPQYAGHERRMSSNVLDFACFHENAQSGDIAVFGIVDGGRGERYIDPKYVDVSDTGIFKWKIVTPKADGNGTFGDTMANPVILPPNYGFTHTFLGIGGFETEGEAQAALKYMKTKFARALLSVLKITQDLNAAKFSHIPLQDFTSASDIDWSQSISEIDDQLFEKYGLEDDEVAFIKSHVKEMS